MKVEVIKGSVVYSNADAIVNAANERLEEGGGVCGAIFQACKDPVGLEHECQKIGYCSTGNAVITKSYGLNSKYIIHAVGPMYFNGIDPNILLNTYINALKLADNYKLESIAFCSISTGIFGYPLTEASKIAIKAINDYEPKYLKNCYFYCFQDNEYKQYCKSLENIQI